MARSAGRKHTATVTLDSGKLVLEAVSVISGNVHGRVDTAPIRTALHDVGDPTQSDYSPAFWAVFAATRQAAENAPDGQPGLDTIGVDQLVNRLEDALDNLVPPDLTDNQRDLGLIGALGIDDALPGSVEIDGVSHDVTWTRASAKAARTAYATLRVQGWTNDAYVDGKKQAFVAGFEVVPPKLDYYIDSGLAGGQTSPQFEA